jgi:hypothetical protein
MVRFRGYNQRNRFIYGAHNDARLANRRDQGHHFTPDWHRESYSSSAKAADDYLQRSSHANSRYASDTLGDGEFRFDGNVRFGGDRRLYDERHDGHLRHTGHLHDTGLASRQRHLGCRNTRLTQFHSERGETDHHLVHGHARRNQFGLHEFSELGDYGSGGRCHHPRNLHLRVGERFYHCETGIEHDLHTHGDEYRRLSDRNSSSHCKCGRTTNDHDGFMSGGDARRILFRLHDYGDWWNSTLHVLGEHER